MPQITDSKMLRNGAAALNSWRAKNPDGIVTINGEIFEGLDLSGANLASFRITACRFTRCNLKYINFSDTFLECTEFEDSDLSNASFVKSDLRGVSFLRVDLSGSNFKEARSLSRIKRLQLSVLPAVEPKYELISLPFYDIWWRWDRLRFLATIRIFVPAYASLTLSVLTLDAAAWLNIAIDRANIILNRLAAESLPAIPDIEPSWKYLATIISFLLLAVSATSFLACPSRISEFSRERWIAELDKPEILYDHAAWSKPWLRSLCAISLMIGGGVSLLLLLSTVVNQIFFVLKQVAIK